MLISEEVRALDDVTDTAWRHCLATKINVVELRFRFLRVWATRRRISRTTDHGSSVGSVWCSPGKCGSSVISHVEGNGAMKRNWQKGGSLTDQLMVAHGSCFPGIDHSLMSLPVALFHYHESARYHCNKIMVIVSFSTWGCSFVPLVGWVRARVIPRPRYKGSHTPMVQNRQGFSGTH